MAVNKVVYGNNTLIDITDSTVNPQNVMEGQIFYDASGIRKTGLKLNDIYSVFQGKDVDENGHWIRPEEYPNLDLIQMPDSFDGAYFTYDLRINQEINWISLYCQTSDSNGVYNIERGHLENNIFIADETFTQNRNTYFRQALNSQNGDIQLWRIWSTNKITQLTFASYTGYNNKAAMDNNQPCVERKASLDYMTSHSGSPNSTSNRCWATSYLKKDYLEDKGLNNGIRGALSYLYGYAYSLIDLDLTNVNTSNWVITTMSYSFIYCYNLTYLDLSTWDTSGWTMSGNNTLYSTWNLCHSLRQLKISNWDTSNWGVKVCQSTFAKDYSLKELDLSKWDTSNWAVTSFYNVFSSCYNLEKLDISTWDVSNWNVTSISYTFSSLRRLKELDLSKWDTSNWSVTSMTSLFSGCWSLKKIKVFQDVSNWNPVSIGSLFSGCYSLEEIDLSTWDTSTWTDCKVVEYLFNSCSRVKKIDISKFDTSHFTLPSTANTCRSIFANCYNLQELDLSHIDCSNWSVMGIGGIFGYNHNLRKIKLPKNLDLSTATNSSQLLSYDFQLREIEGPTVTNLTVPFALTDIRLLTTQSLVNIFNMLGTLTETKTFKISTSNLNKLTDAQIAIATAKGWTITA